MDLSTASAIHPGALQQRPRGASLCRLWRALSEVLAPVPGRVFAWQERRARRHAMETLSERTLRDIGLTRVDVFHQSRKPSRLD
jgi:uncharacterized protein YjiS (DUF1127 family)